MSDKKPTMRVMVAGVGWRDFEGETVSETMPDGEYDYGALEVSVRGGIATVTYGAIQVSVRDGIATVTYGDKTFTTDATWESVRYDTTQAGKMPQNKEP